MSCLSPWDKDQGGRVVGTKVIPPMINISLGESVPRDIGSVLFRDVSFGVTFWNSELGGGLFPKGSIGGGGSSTLVFVDRPVGTKSLGPLEFWNLGM